MTIFYDYNLDMLKKVPIHELKAKLSYFLKLMQNGEKFIVMKHNIEIGELNLQPTKKGKRELGAMAKRYPNFKWDFSSLEEPLMTDEEVEEFENSPIFPGK